MPARAKPRVWALFYANGGLTHLEPGDELEQHASIRNALDELAIRFSTGNGNVPYCTRGTEYTVFPDHDPGTCYALVWLAAGRDLPPGQPPDATSAPDEKWRPGPRGGVVREPF